MPTPTSQEFERYDEPPLAPLLEISRHEPVRPATLDDREHPCPRGDRAPTVFLDWDRERYGDAVPRAIAVPVDEPGPAWLAVPHARYILCVRHRAGRIEQVYVTSLIGRRDSLIPAGDVERIVSDDRSVTLVVDGRPHLYVVESGATVDVIARRVLGVPQT